MARRRFHGPTVAMADTAPTFEELRAKYSSPGVKEQLAVGQGSAQPRNKSAAAEDKLSSIR